VSRRPETPDYLWDGRGPVDPEVAQLESTLRDFRQGGEPLRPETFARAAEDRDDGWDRSRRQRLLQLLGPWLTPPRLVAFGAACGLALLAAGLGMGLWTRRAVEPWQVAALAGRPRIEGAAIQEGATLRPGQRLSTDGSSLAHLALESVGEVEVGPGSELRLLAARRNDQRLALAHGQLRARIWAPPALFQVETPSARAVDLGCVYTIAIDPNGEGRLSVDTGWVALTGGAAQNHESFVPAGASAALSRSRGPGIPVWDDGPAALKVAVATFERMAPGAERRLLLNAAASVARPRDALTVWHLLARATPAERQDLYDPLARLAPPPRGTDRAAVVRGERAALDAWWNALGLGSSSWWRMWRAPLG
jgi:hypothetical protein